MIGCRCEHRVLEEVKKRKLRIIMTTGKRQGDSLVVATVEGSRNTRKKEK